MRIAAVAFNSVRHDNRIIREALALSRVGHEVTIIGIRDSRAAIPTEELAPRCRIVRVSFRSREQRFLALSWLALSMVPAAAATWILARPPRPEPSITSAFLSGGTRAAGMAGAHPGLVVVAFLAALLTGAGLVRARKARRASRGYSRLEGGAVTPRLSKSVWDSLRAVRTLLGREIRLRFVGRAVRDELEQLRPDAVHCHDLLTLPMGVRHKKQHPCFLVYDSHEIFEEMAGSSPLSRLYYRRLQRRCSGGVDAFITVNDSIAGLLNSRYPLLPKAVVVKNAAELHPAGQSVGLGAGLPKAVVVENAMDPPGHGGPGARGGRLHETTGLEMDQRILLYHGGFSPDRGLESLVGAASRLPRNWRIILMGWGRLEATLRRRAKIADPRGDRVFFLPPVPPEELMLWTMDAAVGIIPYQDSCLNHRFCTPNKLWEYPAAGVPIIVSPLPELVDTVTTHDIGWVLWPYTDAETIGACLAAITESELRRKRRSCEAFIRKDNWHVYGRRLTELYAALSPPDPAGRPGTPC